MERRSRYLITVAAFALASLTATPELLAQSRDLHVTTAEQVWEGPQAGARAGTWLDQGTMSAGDNRRDLIIGTPGGPGLFGTVHVIYGGRVRTGTLNLVNADAVITGESAGDLFGTSTAVGSILVNESIDPKNLLVGAPNAQGGRGAVYLFRGAFGTLASATASDAVFKIIGAPGDALGTMLATADLDNDGYREIIIGAPGNNRVYVIRGGPSLSGIQDLSVTPAARTITQPGIGSVMTAGDVTGDNIQDLLLGAPSRNAVYLYEGAAGVLPSSPAAIFGGLDTGDDMGASLRLADMDADGKRDILIGAPGGDGPDNTRTNAGEVYLIWGGTTLTSRNMLAADVTFYGVAGEGLGASLAAGDVNRDTPNDAVMLAKAAAGGSGILYVYYGRSRATFGTALGNGSRIVDFATAGQVSRRIGSDPTLGAIVAAQVFEVTGEGARDIIVGIPTTNSGAGSVYFTLSPKMQLSDSSVSLGVKHGGGTAAAAVQVINATTIPITWDATSNRDWLTLSPASGSADNTTPGTITINAAAAAALALGTYTGTVTVRSTSPDLTMSLPIEVTLHVTQTVIRLDGPADGSTVTQPFNIGGWALDLGSTSGTGVDTIHVWAFPTNGSDPVFLGVGNSGGPRPDVGAIYGHQFDTSGWNLQITGLTPGIYQIVAYAHNAYTKTFDDARVVTTTVTASTAMGLNTPQANMVVNDDFYIQGWAIDAAAKAGPGVDAIHVWAFPTGGGPATFLGVGVYGDSRPDVGNFFGSRFTNSGFHLMVSNLAPGTYTVVIYAHSSLSGKFDNSRGVPITVVPSARMSLDAPANNSTIGTSFNVGGWAIDLSSTTGSGVDAVHVWATPAAGGTAQFLGEAVYGTARPDVGGVYGSRFTNSGYNLTVNSLAPGTYAISVYAHSKVDNAFTNVQVSYVTVR